MSIEYFSGVCQWAKLREDNIDVWNGKRSWQITVELDGPTRKRIRELGIKNKLREDDEGRFWMNFSRPDTKNFGKGIQKLDPPKVVDKDEHPFTGLIGNGSHVTVGVVVYSGQFTDVDSGEVKPYTAARLEAVRINDLVPYEPPASTEGNDSVAFPKLTGKEKKDESIKSDTVVDDELPF